jgi:hypothetical protein
MRVKKVSRYYCDHCKKAGCQRAAMARHERGCIRNPNRVCGFCAAYTTWGGEYQHEKTLSDLIAVLQTSGLEALKESAGNCPGCVFAAIVQSRESQRKAVVGNRKPTYFDVEFKEGFISEEAFNFKEACEKFWAVVNEWKEEQMRRY